MSGGGGHLIQWLQRVVREGCKRRGTRGERCEWGGGSFDSVVATGCKRRL